MITRVSSILVALAIVGFVAGCSESPTAQYENAKMALEKAGLAEAGQYAPATFKEATDSLNAAMVEMQKQDGKFSAFRSYGKAEEILTVAQQLADKADREALAEKEKVRLADSALISEIESLITETRNIIAKAPRGKGSRIDLKVMQSDIDAASGALTAATEEFRSEKYLIANEKLQAIKSQIVKVKSEIEAAVDRLSGK